MSATTQPTATATPLTVGEYVLANRLIGFRYSALRVLITRIDGDNVFVRTADLADAGTPLVLSPDKIERMQEAPELWRHADGLIYFAG